MLILGGLMLAIVLSALDQTIVSTALPMIASDLGNVRNLSWVIGALSGGLTSMFFWTLPVIAAGFLLAFVLPNPEMDDDPGPENPS